MPPVTERPTETSGNPKEASSAATTTSQHRANSAPAPRAYPCTAATTGAGDRRTSRVTSWISSSLALVCSTVSTAGSCLRS